MSARAVGSVWDHAPYTGNHLLVLLAIADVVNDTHDNRFWMTVPDLAKKARVSPNTARTALHRFVADGWLEVVSASKGRRPSEYRFRAAPSATLQDSECSANPPTSGDQPSNDRESTPQRPDRAPLSIPREPKKSNPSARLTARDGAPDPRFLATWEHYPRKLNRKGAFRAWSARVRSGADPADLAQATLNYAQVRRGQDPTHTMHGATFFGPDERWRDYLDDAPAVTERTHRRPGRKQSKGERALEVLAEMEGRQVDPMELTR